jgi:hypothetical protein
LIVNKMKTIDMTPTWREWGIMYARLAETGERKACAAMRPDLLKALTAAEALSTLINRGMLSPEALQVVKETMTPQQRAEAGVKL